MATRRIDLVLSEKEAVAFELLIRECGFESLKDYINNELTLLKRAVQAVKEGKSIGIVDEINKSVEVIQMPWMKRVKVTSQG